MAQLASRDGPAHAGREADCRIRVTRVVGTAMPDLETLERRRPKGWTRAHVKALLWELRVYAA